MPNYRRLYVPGAVYFFTVNLHDRRSKLLTENIGAFRASWSDIARTHRFETIAVAVLPEHTHFIWRLPENDQDFSTRIRLLKTGFTRRLGAESKAMGRKGERNIWQRRFWEHLIRDDKDLEAHIAYVHGNPVKHGHVTDADDWPYSSWHQWKREHAQPRGGSAQEWAAGLRGER
jgi:putative transposase